MTLNKRWPLMSQKYLPSWSWGDRWRAGPLWRTPCCGPAVRDRHTELHLNPAWFCIWQRLRLRRNGSGKLDYKILDMRSTREGFITSAFGAQTWFSSAQLVYIHWNPHIHQHSSPLRSTTKWQCGAPGDKENAAWNEQKYKSDSAMAQPPRPPV